MTKLTVFFRALACLLLSLPVLAVPVAVNDTYTAAEDTVLVPTGTPLVSAAFNSGADGWTYVDDPFPSPFNTNAPGNATGSVNTTRGVGATGCLLVDVGRRPPTPRSSSGAFSRTFTLAAGATLEVKFNYRLRAVDTSYSFFASRYADAVFMIDGIRYGNGTSESLVGSLHAFDDRHGHPFLRKFGVHIEDGQRFSDGLLFGSMCGVALLPEEFRCAKEQAGAQLPAHHVCPLVDEQREVTVAVNPSAVGVPDDGLGSGANDEFLLQFGRRVNDYTAAVRGVH